MRNALVLAGLFVVAGCATEPGVALRHASGDEITLSVDTLTGSMEGATNRAVDYCKKRGATGAKVASNEPIARGAILSGGARIVTFRCER